jgi:hypothetical protein
MLRRKQRIAGMPLGSSGVQYSPSPSPAESGRSCGHPESRAQASAKSGFLLAARYRGNRGKKLSL